MKALQRADDAHTSTTRLLAGLVTRCVPTFFNGSNSRMYHYASSKALHLPFTIERSGRRWTAKCRSRAA